MNLEPPTPASLLAEHLVERLKGVPVRILSSADHELARVAFERLANFYFVNHAADSRPEQSRYLLISEHAVRWTRQMDIDEAERIFGGDIIHIRACLNAIDQVAIWFGVPGATRAHRKYTWEDIQRAIHGRLHPEPRKLDDWKEEDGPVLWWRFPIVEPPYVGSPLSEDFPDYVTHWTPLVLPRDP